MGTRLFVLFLDGADYGFLRRAMDRGLTPNLAKMAAQGAFGPLATSYPAESPVAFAEVLTGCNPGKHGIFDFLHRDPATYMPRISLYDQGKTGYRNRLACPTLCAPLKRGGVKTALIRLPCTFPPPPEADLVLSGLGTPDACGAWGRAQVFSPDEEEGTDLFGTLSRPYREDSKGQILLELAGPGGTIPIVLRREGSNFRLGETVFPAGTYSPWMPIDFQKGAQGRGRGVMALRVTRPEKDSKRIEVQVTPLWSHPVDSPLPALRPAERAAEFIEASGLFPLAGWPEPNMALAQHRIDFPDFLEMCRRNAAIFEAHAFEALSDPSMDLVMANHELFDRVAHAGFGPTASDQVAAAIEGVLARFDAFVGQVRDAFPSARIWIASDHGFAPWKKRVNVNRYLAETGYLAADLSAPDPNLQSLSEGRVFWQGVDWSRTRAYGLGLSKVFINLEGRESLGTVPPGRPAELLLRELIAHLEALKDPETGGRVFRRVLDSRRVYWGQAREMAGDLILCYNAGYRTDWVSSLGGVGTPVVYPNTTGWLGDHCGVDPELIPGVLISSGKVRSDAPCLRDIAPSVLAHFSLPKERHMDGDAILE